MSSLSAAPADSGPATVNGPTENPRLWELSDRERRIFDAGFHHGYALGASSRQPEIDALNHEADRYYAEMCRRPAPRTPEHISYTELCRRRGEHERAERNEELLRSRGIIA